MEIDLENYDEKALSKSTLRTHLFTVTNWNVQKLQLEKIAGCDYLGGIQEISPEGKGGENKDGKHWQQFVHFARAIIWRTAKQRIGPNCHILHSRGSLLKNEDYCTLGKKRNPPDTTGIPGSEYRQGERPAQGHRTDLDTAGELAKAGNLRDINLSTYIRFHRGLQAVMELHRDPYEGERKVYWVWGAAGVGKSRWARERAGQGAYWQKVKGGWFQGYRGQETVVIDDIDHETLDVRTLLGITDRYPMTVALKGSHQPWMAKTIIFTSVFKPEQIVGTDRAPELLRRINELIHIT